jgi:ribosomal protein S20
MKLHKNTDTFKAAIQETSDYFEIRDYLIEKDYWITFVLSQLAKSAFVKSVVFKGGTSLSKAFRLIDRFSEDVDIAVMSQPDWTGNKIKTLIRNVEKKITSDLIETESPGITSKGSRFRKSVYRYPTVLNSTKAEDISDKLIVEINSFANPYPNQQATIQSMIGEYFQDNDAFEIIEKFDLQEFELNVLDKNQTLLEKLVSLIRFSFDENPVQGVAGKIRHFYDLHYLMQDEDCLSFVNRKSFKNDFTALLEHDKAIFDDPEGWKIKNYQESPILSDFDKLWENLKLVYTSELEKMAFKEIPHENNIKKSFKTLIGKLKES